MKEENREEGWKVKDSSGSYDVCSDEQVVHDRVKRRIK